MTRSLAALALVGGLAADQGPVASSGWALVAAALYGLYFLPAGIAIARGVPGVVLRNVALGWWPPTWVRCLVRAIAWRRPVPPPVITSCGQYDPWAPPTEEPAEPVSYAVLDPWAVLAHLRNHRGN